MSRPGSELARAGEIGGGEAGVGDEENVRRRLRGGPRPGLGCVVVLLIASLAGCATFERRTVRSYDRPLRLSEVVGQGDPARRASLRLLVEGLAADAAGRVGRAQGSYERAIQVDPSNPYAYLVLARHRLDGTGESAHAIELVEQAAAYFESEGLRDPRIDMHLIGLRGQALQQMGRYQDGSLLLERARVLAPSVWNDGHLSADELR